MVIGEDINTTDYIIKPGANGNMLKLKDTFAAGEVLFNLLRFLLVNSYMFTQFHILYMTFCI